MSDRLDDDALLLVLDELAAPSPDRDVYCANKQALCNVCLASHRLRRLAQPLLFRQVWVVNQAQADKLKSSRVVSSFGQGTRWYTVGEHYQTGSLAEAVEMAHVLPNVEKLLLAGPDTVGDLAQIESFTKLRHLFLIGAGLQGSSFICQAPLLERLDIQQSVVSIPTTVKWLQPFYLPALRILSVVVGGGADESGSFSRFELSQILGPAMVAQLDLVQTIPHNLRPQSALALGTAPPILVFAPPFNIPSLPRHSVWRIGAPPSAPAVDTTLRRLADLVESSLSSSAAVGRCVVVLPRTVLSLAAQHQGVGDTVRRLERACGRAVRIIWGGEDGMYPLSATVPREFVRYARELKAARLAQEAKGQ